MYSAITPVAIFPGTANRFYVRDAWSNALGSAPQFYYELQSVVPGTPASGVEGEEGYVPAVPEQVTSLKRDNVSMTTEQWQAWPADADDEEIILAALATNLGLTLA